MQYVNRPVVTLIGHTAFTPPSTVPFHTDTDGGQALVEFAGRACYASWAKEVPATATNQGFIEHILSVGHLSVLEHAGATLYITGLSRASAHELLRHRHFSISELSPRSEPDAICEPVAISADPLLHQEFERAAQQAMRTRAALVTELEQRTPGVLGRKQARAQANALTPAGASTTVVVTGNYRSWRHFIGMRGSDAADMGVRELAVAVLEVLQTVAPHVFSDFRISELGDGTRMAASPWVRDR